MSLLTLLRRGNELAEAARQREILEQPGHNLPFFSEVLTTHGCEPLKRDRTVTLQVNTGKLCNQTCRHCHVDAGPDRREVMNRDTFEHCLRVIRDSKIQTVDITGGAPEMNPHFQWFVTELRKLKCHVIDRCNLTILLAPGFSDLPAFLANHQVEIVASLPCYLEQNCDAQRGDGVFQKSISALKLLNQLGYGGGDESLTLSLVYNPVGTSLPPNQADLEQAYRDQLQQQYDIRFDRLYTITNMPISRYLDDLLANDRFKDYMNLLATSFNPSAVDGVMCQSTVSVDWQGYLYDCDFNQMLDLPLSGTSRRHISDVDATALSGQTVAVGRHCFGCTAGAGSSCGGALLGSSDGMGKEMRNPVDGEQC